MKKIGYLIFLFLLLLAITSFALIQIPSLQKKALNFLLQDSPTKITFKESHGFFPLKMHFSHLSIETKELSLFAEEATCQFALLPFFFKTVDLLDLEAKKVTIATQANKPSLSSFPVALKIHHFMITDLFYQNQTLELEGNFFLEKNGDFSLISKGIALDIPWHLFVESISKKIAVTGSLVYTPFNARFLFSGTGDLNQFSGKLLADAKYRTIPLALISSWKYNSSQLLLPNLKLIINNATLQASLRYDLKDAKLGIFGKVMHEPFSLQTVLHKKGSKFSLEPAILHFLDNDINLSFSWSKQDFNLSVLGKFAQIERTQQFFSYLLDSPYPLKGDLFLDLQLQKTAASFSASIQNFLFQNYSIPQGCIEGAWKKGEPLLLNLLVKQFTIQDPFFEILPPINLQASSKLTEKQFLLNGVLEGLGEESFFLSCDLPLLFTLSPFHFSLDFDAPFAASLTGKGRIDPLLSFLENYNIVIQGEMDCELNFFGTLNNPLSHGHLAFQGSLHEVTTAIFLEEVEALILAENKEITIAKLIAHEKTKGLVEIQGQAKLEKGFPLSLQITATSLPLFGFEPLYTETDFVITIEGTLDKLKATGHAALSQAEYRLQKSLPSKIPKLSLTFMPPKEAPLIKQSLLPMDLAIEVTTSTLLIKGNGFDTQWFGALLISGTIQHPLCTGKLNLQKGRLDFARHIFYLTEGEILILGASPDNIHINIRGETDAANIVVFFQASGTIDATEIAFSSSPPLCTQAIFSKLLFDSDLNELTPFQACRLAKFLVGLSSMNSSISKFQSIKESLGIDVFDITHCDFDTYDFTFQVGKYISQGTYVGINKSISGNFDEVEIQTRLFQEFYLEGNLGGSLNGLTPNGGKIIFKWYRSY